MIEKRVQMMDAGMRLFQTEKPFGTVLGGIKTEMAKYGAVLRANETDPSMFPETMGDYDLFLDWSSATKYRYISCKVEDAGEVGTTDEGEPVHRYAVMLKEGNKNKPLDIVIITQISEVPDNVIVPHRRSDRLPVLVQKTHRAVLIGHSKVFHRHTLHLSHIRQLFELLYQFLCSHSGISTVIASPQLSTPSPPALLPSSPT